MGASERDWLEPPEWARGLPTTRHSPTTPEGEIEQLGKIADGLVAGRPSRRLRRGLLVLVLPFTVPFLVLALIDTLTR